MTSSVAIAQRLRELAPQVLATVLRRHPRDLTTAEDAVQEALLAAATQWPAAGLPENPGAWLVRVALRRVADHVRAELARRRREALVVSQLPGEPPAAPAPDDDGTAGLVDDTLPLLFMCCHPALTRPSAIALTLRAVGGLTTREIARAFLVPEATMAQRVSRAKETIRASGVALELPGGAELAARRDGVLHVLYLVFNEGYAASEGEDLARVDLSREAIRLARLLARLAPGDPEVEGLLALMLLTDARRPARTGPSGELVPLDEQDRALWDRALVAEGTALVETAFARGAVGPYQLQAAVAALHDAAPSAEATDWPQIAALYAVLRRLTGDNPAVALSHAVAEAMVHGPAHGLARLDELARDPRLARGHRVDAVRAHLLERAGARDDARAAYRRAAARTASVPERDYLLRRAARLAEP